MSIFQQIAAAVYREYDRRVKRASLITEYGAKHHHDDHGDEDHESEIVNLSRGKTYATQSTQLTTEGSIHNEKLEIDTALHLMKAKVDEATQADEEGEISNISPGTQV